MPAFNKKRPGFSLLEVLVASVLAVVLLMASAGVIINIQNFSKYFQTRVDHNTNWSLVIRHLSHQIHASSYLEIPNTATLNLYDYNGALRGTYTNVSGSLHYSGDNATFTNVAASFQASTPLKDGKIIIARTQLTIPRKSFRITSPTVSTLYLKCGVSVKPSGTTWAIAIGGTGTHSVAMVKQTSDKGYIIAGNTSSFGAGGKDIYY